MILPGLFGRAVQKFFCSFSLKMLQRPRSEAVNEGTSCCRFRGIDLVAEIAGNNSRAEKEKPQSIYYLWPGLAKKIEMLSLLFLKLTR
jgi:hypothetical protein